MPRKKKRSNAAKGQPEVWVSADLMHKLKGPGGSRGAHVPQSPYLLLADRFLGLTPNDVVVGKATHRTPTPHIHKPKEPPAAPEAPLRAMAAAAATDGVLSTAMPRMVYPKPPTRLAPPKPPRMLLSRPPARPKLPKLQPPKPPKVSFGYRSRKSDPKK